MNFSHLLVIVIFLAMLGEVIGKSKRKRSQNSLSETAKTKVNVNKRNQISLDRRVKKKKSKKKKNENKVIKKSRNDDRINKIKELYDELVPVSLRAGIRSLSSQIQSKSGNPMVTQYVKFLLSYYCNIIINRSIAL